MDNVTIGRFDFEWNEDNEFYQCRGEVMYDDEHDEMPEPALWDAAGKLRDILRKRNEYKWDLSYSEKGWVEVIRFNKD